MAAMRSAAPTVMTRIPFDPDAIRALAAVLAETGLSEIEIAEKDSRIRVVRAHRASLRRRRPGGDRSRRRRRAGAGCAGRGQPSRRGHQPDGRRRLSVAGAGRAALRHRRPEPSPPVRRCC